MDPDDVTTEPEPPVIRISGQARPLAPGPILAFGMLGAILFGGRRRALGFALGAGVGYYLQTSGALDQLRTALSRGAAGGGVTRAF